MSTIKAFNPTVMFRPDFSVHLVGVAWEIVGEPMTVPDSGRENAGREWVELRRPNGRGTRWFYRTAWTADLIDYAG